MFKRLGIKDWVARQEILQLNSIGHRILYEINEVDENSRYVSKQKIIFCVASDWIIISCQ